MKFHSIPEIHIVGNIAAAQGIVPLTDLFVIFLNIRERQIKFAGAVKAEPETRFPHKTLDEIHFQERRLDRLDYLRHQMRKQSNP